MAVLGGKPVTELLVLNCVYIRKLHFEVQNMVVYFTLLPVSRLYRM
jgi:hypothetical protein